MNSFNWCIITLSIFLCVLFPLKSYSQDGILIGLIDEQLVEVDVENVSLKKLVDLNLPPDLRINSLAYSSNDCLFYSIVNATDNPILVSIDLAGNYQEIGEFTISGGTVFICETLAYSALDNKLYASASLNSGIDSQDFFSESLVEVNVQDANCTLISTLIEGGTRQTDIDNMEVIEDQLFLHDGATTSFSTFYEFSFDGLGATVSPNNIATISYEPTSDMGAVGNIIYMPTSNFDLYALDVELATVTLLGKTHTSADYNGNPIRGVAYVDFDENCNGNSLIDKDSNSNIDYDDNNASVNAAAIGISNDGIDSVFDNDIDGQFITSSLEQQIAKSLSLFPNPTTGMIYLEDNDYLPNSFRIVVKDYLGKTVYEQQVSRSGIMPIEFQHTNPGLYLLNIHTDYGVFSKKVLVVK